MRKKILIIDDEEDFAYFLKTNLELTTNSVVITSNRGKKGIRTALKEKPDLIILDIMMPGLDGFEVLKKLKENEKTYHIPVIMLTAKNGDESKIKAAGMYCEDYLVKPVETGILRSKISSILQIKNGTR